MGEVLYYLLGMNRLMAYLIPGLVLIVAFALVKTFFVSPEVAISDWFVWITALVTPVCVVVPCVIYYLRTPPGIDHK